ncbi:MAG: acetyl esterase/lipase [Lentimonas sp.]|jgi:acetyl esterase/lipase
MKFLPLVIAFLLSFNSYSQNEIKLKEIMNGQDFIGHWPSNALWHMNGSDIYFQWNPDSELSNSWYKFSTKDSKTIKVKPEENFKIEAFDAQQAQFYEQYYSANGNLLKYNKNTNAYTTIYSSSQNIYNVQRVNNAKHIYFQIETNLFLYNSNNGTLKQVTNFKKGKEKKEDEKTDFLSKQQEELFDFIKEENALGEYRKLNKSKSTLPKAYYIKDENLELLQVSPLENEIYFLLSDYPKNKNTEYQNFITKDGYSTSNNARSKAGSEEAKHTMGLLNIEQDSVYLIDFSTLPGIRTKPKFLSLYGDTTDVYEKDRSIVMHRVVFSENGNAVVDVRTYDNKDRWIVGLKAEKIKTLDHQHDEAWIGGPGIGSWNRSTGTLGWLPDNKTIYFQSEESGFSHLYNLNLESNKKNQITQGSFEIRDVQLNQKGDKFYVHANRSHPGNRGYYSVQIENKKWTNLLIEEGAFEVKLSPDEKNLALLYSTSDQPWEMYWAKNTESTITRQITNSQSESFKKVKWYKPEVIDFLGDDEKNVYARIYEPEQGKTNGAAVIFVHGAGYLQNAHNFWSGYYREYMFHNLLREKGYTVLDIDYRASDGYGRDYRTAIYRHMGGWDLKDQLTGKKLLTEKYGIDSNKVGMYGGSYGGFITLMALLTEPGEFACGAALRSVTDWAHYNHEYTTNILNYPNNDSIAYRQSSPIYFAENLEDPLLILHGMVDDNVQFQDVVRLSQRFIELGKENWEMAVFPVEAHGFVKSSSWYDEYRRILELFDENLLRK